MASPKRSEADDDAVEGGAGGELTVEPARPFGGKGAPARERAAQDDALPAPPILPDPLIEVDEETVRDGLRLQGEIVHAFAAVDPEGDEWAWLERELDTIAPPLTRIVNRYPAIAVFVAEYGDPAIVAGAAAKYMKRSLEERAQAIARVRWAESQQAAGDVTFHVDPQ